MSIRLSRRLQAIADRIPQGTVLCDVGCDHCYIPIYLIQENRISGAIAMDVADGPLKKAQNNLELSGLSDRIQLRKSDGIAGIEAEEAQTLLIAGMGGALTRSILDADYDKAHSFRTIVLEPQSEIYLVREYLLSHDFGIVHESFVEDQGKYYPIITAKPFAQTQGPDWGTIESSCERADYQGTALTAPLMHGILQEEYFRTSCENEFGPYLIRTRDPLLRQYLVENLHSYMQIERNLEGQKGGAAKDRLKEIRGSIGMMQALLFIFDRTSS